jgi:signal transduction histidine kinase/CHASE3 domain sensor protein
MTKLGQWWSKLRVHQKDWWVILLLSVPLLMALSGHVVMISQLLTLQEQHKELLLARDHIRLLSRLGVDIEDGFRGYLVTQQEIFLAPMEEAASKLDSVVADTLGFVRGFPTVFKEIQEASEDLRNLLTSKRAMIEQIRRGHVVEIIAFVRSTKGLAQSNAIRQKVRSIEDDLTRRLQSFKAEEEKHTQSIYRGLLLTAVLAIALGILGVRLLRRSISGPLALLDSWIAGLGCDVEVSMKPIPIDTTDEIGHIARSFERSADRIRRHIRELEAINAISKEINTIRPEGQGELVELITERAVSMLQCDSCLVMLRHDEMSCWVVEAASGDWHQTLRKSVMLWEEFPIAVKAYETRRPAAGSTDLSIDPRPDSPRRNIMAQSELAIPLLSNGKAFGVLLLLMKSHVGPTEWNTRLAHGFAEVAAIAIGNTRTYESVKRKGEGLEMRLQQLEHTAQILAHDLKAPGERMEVLAKMLLEEYHGELDERATRWLTLIRKNGQVLTKHVEDILELASVGSVREAIESVDPALVIDDVLTARSEELKAHNVRVQMAVTFFKVSCHRAYLRQVFDNLISNAIKFSAGQSEPRIRITAKRQGDMIQFSVSDNGRGVPAEQRAHVFEPFVRLDSSIEGSGIGLSIVKRIVEFYQGRIWIEDSSSQGCTVTFAMPMLEDRRTVTSGMSTLEDRRKRNSSGDTGTATEGGLSS